MSMDPGTTTGALTGVDPTVVKSGLVTTEWWTTLLTVVSGTVISILALFGKNLDGSSLQPLIGAVAILAAGISSAYYSHSRGTVKAAAHAAGGALAASQSLSPAVLVGSPILAQSGTTDPVVDQAVPMAGDDGTDH